MRKNRVRQTLFMMLTIAAATAACARTLLASEAPDAPPHIVLIMVDDLGKEWISAYGSRSIATPNIDQLAAAGTMFQNFYCMPQCTPTRLTLLTGQYPFRHGWVNHWDVPRWGGGCSFDPQRNPSMPNMLKLAGYSTVAAGKWQIDDFRQEPTAMRDAGFDEWCMWTGYEAGNPPSGERYWNPYVSKTLVEDSTANKPSRSSKSSPRVDTRTHQGRFGPDIYADYLLDFMTRRHAEGPMFVYFPMALTHGPLVSTPTEPTAVTPLAKHKAMVRYADLLTGKIVHRLDQLGIREQTLIIWTTDNGTSRGIVGNLSGREVRGGKSETSEAGVCVPLIVSWPTHVPAGHISDALVDMTDLLPTLADAANAPLPSATLDGTSFLPVALDPNLDSPRSWIMAMGGKNEAALSPRGVENKYRYRDRVIRDKRFKLFVSPQRTVAKLVDLQNDPSELSDIQHSEDPAVQQTLEKLKRAETGFPRQDNDPRYTPLPHQPWYRQPSVISQQWKTE